VLSTIGIGEGFNEYLMTQIADAGTGNYYYLAENSALASILERELSSTRETVATGLAVRIPGKPGVQVIDAGGYPLQQDDKGTTFQVGSLFAGQERKIWLTLRVPSQSAGSVALGGVELAFTEAGKRKAVSAGEALAIACVKDEKAAFAAIDRSAWERAVVNEEWGKVQEEVARAVHEGKRDEALKRLGDYRAGYAVLNANIGSAAVDSSLAESDALRQKVEDAFQGSDQYGKQNIFSKEQLSKGRKGRRIGSEKQNKGVAP
jgi:Ca-activated chloride channel family protein